MCEGNICDELKKKRKKKHVPIVCTTSIVYGFAN